MNFLSLAKTRYSVRKFKTEPVNREDMDKIIMAGYHAPTGCNFQPHRIIVIDSEDGLKRLRKSTECHFDAPNALLVCYDKTACWRRRYDGNTSGIIDASIVTTHMMLEAADLGVGSTWIMHFNPEITRKEFNIPENIEPVAFLVMGYPAADAQPHQYHSQFKPLEDLVKYNTF